jgi:hypothetical protein
LDLEAKADSEDLAEYAQGRDRAGAIWDRVALNLQRRWFEASFVSNPVSMPISTLLSQALVAFTIELDNEFERRMPHRTSNHGSTDGSRDHPWLVSMAMWSTCMRFVGDEGVRVKELAELAGTTTNLKGMERWGYIVVEADVICATPKGRQAREVWGPLFGIIEKRWQERFGKGKFDQLRESLTAVIRKFDFELPDCLPILGYGLFTRVPEAREAGTSSSHFARASFESATGVRRRVRARIGFIARDQRERFADSHGRRRTGQGPSEAERRVERGDQYGDGRP